MFCFVRWACLNPEDPLDVVLGQGGKGRNGCGRYGSSYQRKEGHGRLLRITISGVNDKLEEDDRSLDQDKGAIGLIIARR